MMVRKILCTALFVSAHVMSTVQMSFSGQKSEEPTLHTALLKNKYVGSIICWPFPKANLNNTSSIETRSGYKLLKPVVKWKVEKTPQFMNMWGYHAVVANVDNIGEPELIIGYGGFGVAPALQSLLCFSVSDGAEKWQFTFEEGERFQWASPNICDIDCDGETEVIFGLTGRIVILNAKNGILEKSWPFERPMCLGTAIFEPGGKPDVFVVSYKGTQKKCHRLDGRDGTRRWDFSTYGSAYNIPAIADINGDGRLEILFHSHRYNPSRETEFCLSSDGKELWHFDAKPSESQNAQSPPELGFVPDFGYTSTMTGDFLGTKHQQVFFATRCHAYLLTDKRQLLWRYPLVKGFGVKLIKNKDGKIKPDKHGTGGMGDYAAAGDINGDSSLDIVMGCDPECRGSYDMNSKKGFIERVDRNNRVIALSGKNGRLLWSFEGNYSNENGLERMLQPVLVELDGRGCLDVVVCSTDGNLYGLDGSKGKLLWKCEMNSNSIQLMAACALKNSVILFLVFQSSDHKSTLVALEMVPSASM